MRYFFLLFLAISLSAHSQKYESPKVLNVYPSTDSIPVNILRFYIQFSKPMQEVGILKHVKLTNQEGQNITGVFYENQFELWNKDRTVVTLLVDPGRVKTGLLAHNNLGRAFVQGQHYTLTIDSLLLDFNDQPLSTGFTKNFFAVSEDIIAPKIELWHHTIPMVETKDDLILYFNDKIDHISALTFIKIFHGEHEIIGNIQLGNGEQQWYFSPNSIWKKGNYEIVVHLSVEDIAANSIDRLFDQKINNSKQINDSNSKISFTIK